MKIAIIGSFSIGVALAISNVLESIPAGIEVIPIESARRYETLSQTLSSGDLYDNWIGIDIVYRYGALFRGASAVGRYDTLFERRVTLPPPFWIGGASKYYSAQDIGSCRLNPLI